MNCAPKSFTHSERGSRVLVTRDKWNLGKSVRCLRQRMVTGNASKAAEWIVDLSRFIRPGSQRAMESDAARPVKRFVFRLLIRSDCVTNCFLSSFPEVLESRPCQSPRPVYDENHSVYVTVNCAGGCPRVAAGYWSCLVPSFMRVWILFFDSPADDERSFLVSRAE